MTEAEEGGRTVALHAEVVGDAVLAMLTEPDGTAKSRRDEQTELAALTAVGLAHHPVLMEQLWANGALRHLAGWWERGAAQSAPGTDVYARALRVAEAGGQEVTGTAMPSEAARLRDVAKSRVEGGPSDERGLARLFVGEDRIVWQSQMAEAAAHGGLDFADLQQAPSLPTLAKLATIPALCRKACRAICTVAAVTAPVGTRSNPRLRIAKRNAVLKLFQPRTQTTDKPTMSQLLEEAQELAGEAFTKRRAFRTNAEKRLSAKEQEDVELARAVLAKAEARLRLCTTSVLDREEAAAAVAEARCVYN